MAEPVAGASLRSVAEIESAVTQLPAGEFAELMAWIQEYQDRCWDKPIEGDLESGRLDAVLAEVEKEYKQGLSRPL